MSGKRDECNR